MCTIHRQYNIFRCMGVISVYHTYSLPVPGVRELFLLHMDTTAIVGERGLLSLFITYRHYLYWVCGNFFLYLIHMDTTAIVGERGLLSLFIIQTLPVPCMWELLSLFATHLHYSHCW